VTGGRTELIVGRNPDGNGKPVAKIKAIRHQQLVLDCYDVSCTRRVDDDKNGARTERDRPRVAYICDCYRDQVKLVRLVRLVVVVKLVVGSTIVVVVVKPLVG